MGDFSSVYSTIVAFMSSLSCRECPSGLSPCIRLDETCPDIFPQPPQAPLEDGNVPPNLGQQDRPFDPRKDDSWEPLHLHVVGQVSLRLGPAQGIRDLALPGANDLLYALTEPIMDVAQLQREIPEGASAHAPGLPLHGEKKIKEVKDLFDRVLPEAKDPPAYLLPGPQRQAVQDGKPEIVFALEVVVKIALSNPTLPKDLLQTGAVKSPPMDKPAGSL